MKRVIINTVSAALIFCLMAVFSCRNDEKPRSESTKSSEERVFISGSAAVMPLLKVLAREFSNKEKGIEIIFLPASHSKSGITGTVENQYDIGAISREMLPNEKASQLHYLHLAVDGQVFATNADVMIRDLNSDQIRDIYAGKVTNWSELAGPDMKITVIDRPEHTSAKITLRRTFLGDSLHVTPDAVLVERPWQVVDSIQLISGSIGYVSLGDIVMGNPAVNIINVNGVMPSLSNLKARKYKYFRPFGIVIDTNPKASAMRFINFIFSETGSKIIENSGFAPVHYEILIGIVPEQNIMVQERRYKPLAEYLSQALGEKFSVRLQLFSTYMEVCQALAQGRINAAFLGSFAYATVRKYVDVVARPHYNGISTYKGLLFARSDSGIQGLEHMRGKRLVLGGKTTTAGYVFPLFYFKENGISEYRNFFSESRFVGTHEDAVLAVLHRNADVGAAKDLILNMLLRENPGIESQFRILAESPPVPSNAFVVRKDIALPCFDCHQTVAQRGMEGEKNSDGLSIVASIEKVLLSISEDPAGREVLSALGNASGFLKTTDSDYIELYRMLEAIGLEPGAMAVPDNKRPSGQ